MKIEFCSNPGKVNKTDVMKNLSQMCQIFSHHNVKFAYLFGSVLDENRIPNDLDIAVMFEVPNQGRDWFSIHFDIYEDLCRLFHMDNIDLVFFDKVPVSLRFRIIKTGISIYETNQKDRTNFEQDVTFLYHESEWFTREYWTYLYKRVKIGLFEESVMFDKERLSRYFSMLIRSANELKKLQALSWDEYVGDEKTKIRAEYHLRIALEAVLDIGRHIIAAQNFQKPDSSRSIIAVLGREGVIPAEFAEKIRPMAGMRNVLVHLYWDVNHQILYDTIKNDLDDFQEYARYVMDYIATD